MIDFLLTACVNNFDIFQILLLMSVFILGITIGMIIMELIRK